MTIDATAIVGLRIRLRRTIDTPCAACGHSIVVISQGAMIIQGSHDYKQVHYPTYSKPVVLEDGSWVGAGAIITLGVTLKSHAVLAAGSVATKDLEPYTIHQGNPAVMVRERVIA